MAIIARKSTPVLHLGQYAGLNTLLALIAFATSAFRPVLRLRLAPLAALAFGLLVVGADAQLSALRDYEVTLDVGDEPGVVPDERYELPEKYVRKVVFYRTSEPVGTIIVETRERALFLVLSENRAIRYGIGVGRDGFRWKGLLKISRKAEWPDWRPPAEMIERQPYLPRFMAGGAGNPLGARALYLGNTVYRIHGTNQPHTIGEAVSSGCFRLVNSDVIDLFERVPVGTRVVVQP
jgi:lipoprotein-anchoring transpeptidase ErfK/SrfK